MIGGLIIAIAFVALLFFLVAPWLAAVYLICILVGGLAVYAELKAPEIAEPDLADMVDLKAELECKGRLPRPKDYEGLAGKTRVGLDREAS